MLWILFPAHKEFNLSQFVGSSFSLTLPPFATPDGIRFNWSTEVGLYAFAYVFYLYICVCVCLKEWKSVCARASFVTTVAGSPFPLENEIFNEIYLFVALNHLLCLYFGYVLVVLLSLVLSIQCHLVRLLSCSLCFAISFALWRSHAMSSFLAESVYFIVVHNLFFVLNSRSRYDPYVCLRGVSVCICKCSILSPAQSSSTNVCK